MSALQTRTAEVFAPLLTPARYKGAHGGRGSGKSHFFAERAVVECIKRPGTRVVCVREIQRSLKESVKRLVEDKIEALAVSDRFNVLNDQIRTPGDGLVLFQGMQDHTAESIKSLEGFDIAYVEEAQTLSARSLEMLRPTIRKPGSELWFSWNPRTDEDPVDKLLRGVEPPPNSIVVRANYDTNPFFPAVLEEERLYDLKHNAARYKHVWEGAYEPAALGAYYAQEMMEALAARRICSVPHDPSVSVQTWWDLGIDDSTVIWFVQYVGREIHVIDYIEDSDKALPHYAKELDRRPYRYDAHILPHDAGARELGTGKTREETLQSLGMRNLIVTPQQDVADGINATRLIIPRCWFDETKCARGLKALRNYRREYDDDKKVYKKTPLHDWSSHAADAFRTGAMGGKIPGQPKKPKQHESGAGAWMG